MGKMIAVTDAKGHLIDSDKGPIQQWFPRVSSAVRRFEGRTGQVVANVDATSWGGHRAGQGEARKERHDDDLRQDRHRERRSRQGQHRRRARRALGDKEVAETRARRSAGSHPPSRLAETRYRTAGTTPRKLGQSARNGAAAERCFAAYYEKQYPPERADGIQAQDARPAAPVMIRREVLSS